MEPAGDPLGISGNLPANPGNNNFLQNYEIFGPMHEQLMMNQITHMALRLILVITLSKNEVFF